jgi:CRP/FNR family transcriptional regulator, cyclic AMP receptor protein
MSTTYFELFTRRDEDAIPVEAGDKIFEAGDASDCFYVVRDGEVLIHAGDDELERVGRGGIFGEMALVDGAPRSASATALSDGEIVLISQERFRYLIHEVPYFALEVMRVMADRLRATTQRALSS